MLNKINFFHIESQYKVISFGIPLILPHRRVLLYFLVLRFYLTIISCVFQPWHAFLTASHISQLLSNTFASFVSTILEFFPLIATYFNIFK